VKVQGIRADLQRPLRRELEKSGVKETAEEGCPACSLCSVPSHASREKKLTLIFC
jgi:hypothetical protein